MKPNRITAVIIFSILLPISQSFACTIIVSDDGKNVFAGNNEDFENDKKSQIWFYPHSNNKYGTAFWGFQHGVYPAKLIPQGGMNEKGLFFDGTSVPRQELFVDESKKNAKSMLLTHLLRKFASVEEVVKHIESINLEGFAKGQLLVADKTGDWAIIENNAITRRSDKNYCIAANFRPSNPKLGGYPSKEYTIADKILNDNNDATVENFEKVLKQTHDFGRTNSTIYSQICDLKNGIIHLYHFHDFEHSVKLDLNKELNKGRHRYFFSKLFAKRIVPELYETYKNDGIQNAIKLLNNSKKDTTLKYCESELVLFIHLLLQTDKFEDATTVCDILLKDYPNSDAAYFMKGKISYYQKDQASALKNFKTAYGLNTYNTFAAQIIQQIEKPQKTGNVFFCLKGYENAECVTIIMKKDGWEDLLHIMYKNGNEWNYYIDLEDGKYQYVYVVDGKYVVDPNVKEIIEYPSTKVMIKEI